MAFVRDGWTAGGAIETASHQCRMTSGVAESTLKERHGLAHLYELLLEGAKYEGGIWPALAARLSLDTSAPSLHTADRIDSQPATLKKWSLRSYILGNRPVTCDTCCKAACTSLDFRHSGALHISLLPLRKSLHSSSAEWSSLLIKEHEIYLTYGERSSSRLYSGH